VDSRGNYFQDRDSVKQNCRIRLSTSAWTAIARELLSRSDLPTSHQISRSLQIGAPESSKRAYEYLIQAMIQLVGVAEPAPAPSKPVPCVENMSRKEEIERRRHRTRVYGYEQKILGHPYNMILLCSPKYQDSKWDIHDPRFAIIREDGRLSLKDSVNRYYAPPDRTIIVVNVASRHLRDQLVDLGFQFCHWLGGEGEYWVQNAKTRKTEHVATRDGEAQRTMNVKMGLMKQHVEALLTEIYDSNVLPTDKRTPKESDRLDNRLDHCATRFMFRCKYGHIGANSLSQKLVSKAHHILRNDTAQ